MSTRSLQFAILALMAAMTASAQLGQVSQQAGEAAQGDSKVRVYVYRNPGITGKEFRPSVYVDEQDIARLQAGHNVILAMNPGPHTFRSTDKKDQFTLDLKPGERYFVRIDVSPVALKGRGKLTVVLPDQGEPEYGQTKPADRSMVRDRSLIAPEFVAK